MVQVRGFGSICLRLERLFGVRFFCQEKLLRIQVLSVNKVRVRGVRSVWIPYSYIQTLNLADAFPATVVFSKTKTPACGGFLAGLFDRRRSFIDDCRVGGSFGPMYRSCKVPGFSYKLVEIFGVSIYLFDSFLTNTRYCITLTNHFITLNSTFFGSDSGFQLFNINSSNRYELFHRTD